MVTDTRENIGLVFLLFKLTAFPREQVKVQSGSTDSILAVNQASSSQDSD